MRRLIERVFARYGTEAVLQTAEATSTVKVFFQSVNSKSWQNMETVLHPLGYLPGGQYVCMFPAETAAAAGDVLTVAGAEYRVCRVADMPVCEKPLYRWAICTGKGGEEAWD